ncbi:hypothetical protein BKA62DRAFT_691004 [Auriculariales sp. MPI-PUGE-AT-0066]|nr:hypothetical protein BKA62DRAFT_691004 [Auriculariales sp. MPI-PUGE-AT-0066]
MRLIALLIVSTLAAASWAAATQNGKVLNKMPATFSNASQPGLDLTDPFSLNPRSLWSDSPSGSSLDLMSRQSCNPGYHLCADGAHCAPSGYFCCPGNSGRGCENGSKCCNSSETCAPSGYKCCSGSQYSCPSTSSCCSGGTCADAGYSCCGIYQCSSSQTCCGNGAGCAPSGTTCCGSEHYCEAGTSCCKDGGSQYCSPVCCGKNVACAAGDKCCTDQDGDKFCSDSCHDTWNLDFSKFPKMDEIFENMCRGIAQSGSGLPNEIILEHNKNKTAARANRRAAGCRGSGRLDCKGLYGPDWECDEFPFASTVQGGALAAARCVPKTQNGLIGGIWGSQVSGKTSGTKYRFKISGFDCSKALLRKREEVPRIWDDEAEIANTASGILLALRQSNATAIIRNDTNSLLVDGTIFGNSSQGRYAYIAPIETPDDYDFQGMLKIGWSLTQGMLTAGSVIDDAGEIYHTMGQAVAGSVDEATVQIGQEGTGDIIIIGWAEDPDLQIDLTRTIQSTGSGTGSDTQSGDDSDTASQPPGALGAAGRVTASLLGCGWSGLLAGILLAII